MEDVTTFFRKKIEGLLNRVECRIYFLTNEVCQESDTDIGEIFIPYRGK